MKWRRRKAHFESADLHGVTVRVRRGSVVLIMPDSWPQGNVRIYDAHANLLWSGTLIHKGEGEDFRVRADD
jgi:hypothetical protein